MGVALTGLAGLLLRARLVQGGSWGLAQILLLQNKIGERVSKVAVSVSCDTGHEREHPLSPAKFSDQLIRHLQVVFHTACLCCFAIVFNYSNQFTRIIFS